MHDLNHATVALLRPVPQNDIIYLGVSIYTFIDAL